MASPDHPSDHQTRIRPDYIWLAITMTATAAVVAALTVDALDAGHTISEMPRLVMVCFLTAMWVVYATVRGDAIRLRRVASIEGRLDRIEEAIVRVGDLLDDRRAEDEEAARIVSQAQQQLANGRVTSLVRSTN